MAITIRTFESHKKAMIKVELVCELCKKKFSYTDMLTGIGAAEDNAYREKRIIEQKEKANRRAEKNLYSQIKRIDDGKSISFYLN